MIADIRARWELEKKEGTSYIRQFSEIPFQVTFFMDEQIEMVKLLRASGHPIIAHVDSTGKLIKQIPGVSEQSNLLLYGSAVTNPTKGSPPLALCEFISDSRDTSSIATALNVYNDM